MTSSPSHFKIIESCAAAPQTVFIDSGVVAALSLQQCILQSQQPSMTERPKGPRGKSLGAKRNVRIDGHLTSVHLEGAFWNAFKEIAAAQGTTTGRLITTIDHERQHINLSSAIRLFVLNYYRSRIRP
jgi:predicted DNA-binding ribbon-helix-helix protein